jgi:GNAT superfamily N-acetyltransferase
VPEFRRHGIGALLMRAAEREAASLGIERLHLYTPGSQPFYARLGWSVLGHRPLPGGMVAVMCKQVGVRNVRH